MKGSSAVERVGSDGGARAPEPEAAVAVATDPRIAGIAFEADRPDALVALAAAALLFTAAAAPVETPPRFGTRFDWSCTG